MKVYADTSFLVSLLSRTDAGHTAAREFFGRHSKAAWLVSPWSFFETVNVFRQLCVHFKIPKGGPEALRRYFKHLHREGPFESVDVSMPDAIQSASEISAAHGFSMVCRSADILHLGILDHLDVDIFVTRDRKQHDLARAAGIPSRLVG